MGVSGLSTVVFLIICQTAFGAKDCPVKFHGIEGHSACLPTSPDYISGGVSKEDIKVILEEHNIVRAGVDGCDMLKMYWNEDIAYVARRYAKNCKFIHDANFKRSLPGSFFCGQNLGSGYSTWKSAINAWASEVKDFTLGGKNVLAKVGHYTQMVSFHTASIGCGFAKCKGMVLTVCNYGPSGNIGSDGMNKPYKQCPKGTGLKDCKGKFCKNANLMKKGSCECKCQDWKHLYGPDCSTNCSVKDTSPCGDSYKANECSTYYNVPPQCPWTCKTCPYITGNTGAAAFKSSVMSLLPVMVLFVFNYHL